VGTWSDFVEILRRDRSAAIAGAIILLYCLTAVLGPMVVHVPRGANPAAAYQLPSLRYPLGTDFIGHSVLSEVIVGTRPVLEIGFVTAFISVGIGTVVGLVSGAAGGVVDGAIMRVTDVFLTIPGLPLLIVIASLVHTANPVVLGLILSVVGWPGLARAVRSQALSLRESAFMEAARAQGLRRSTVIGRQLLPNVGPYVAIHWLLAVTGAIYAEVGLFLLGVAPVSGNNWGSMINLAMGEGALYTGRSMPWLLAPMAAIICLQVAFVFFTRALDQFFNPRLRLS
jgi:peptide/nickel transport system permease protein